MASDSFRVWGMTSLLLLLQTTLFGAESIRRPLRKFVAPLTVGSFPLFPIHQHSQAAFQLELGPEDYSLQLLDEGGFKGRPVPIPFCSIHQVTADSSGSLLAVFGSVVLPGRAGWIAPVESCLIDMESGDVRPLPYSAAAFQGDVLYFVQDHTLYKKELFSSRARLKCQTPRRQRTLLK